MVQVSYQVNHKWFKIPSVLPSGFYSPVTSSGNISSRVNIIGNQLVIGGGTFTSEFWICFGGGRYNIMVIEEYYKQGFPTLFSQEF